jgi:hypothetical protein
MTTTIESILAKTPAQLDSSDISVLATAGLPEDPVTEFKQAVSGNWAESLNLTRDAQNDLIKEIVAFANSFGGSLYIGIEESADDPKRSAGLMPVPQVGKLASILENVLRDCVEPRLLSPEIVPVVTDPTTGAGVLVVRVTRSPLAPHWNKAERRCYRRIGTSSLPIGMLDIQSLTLERARTSEDVERLFVSRRQNFSDVCDTYARERASQLSISNWSPNQPIPTRFAIRCTAVPAIPVTISNLTGRPDLKLGVGLVLLAGSRQALPFPAITETPFFRPSLRAWSYERRGDGGDSYLHHQVVRGDGIIESIFMRAPSVNDPTTLPVEHILASIFGLLFTLETFRGRTNLTSVPYELELEITTHGVVEVDYFQGHPKPGLLRFHKACTVFPRYLFEGRSSVEMLVQAIQHDLWNAMGRQMGGPIMSIELDLPFMWQLVDQPFAPQASR